jgi:hypothetical protein
MLSSSANKSGFDPIPELDNEESANTYGSPNNFRSPDHTLRDTFTMRVREIRAKADEDKLFYETLYRENKININVCQDKIREADKFADKEIQVLKVCMNISDGKTMSNKERTDANESQSVL